MISIVIPTCSDFQKYLKSCCESIIKNTDLSDIEVIVVGNGATGASVYVHSLGVHFRVISFDDPIGYTRAVNEGMALASGEYVVLLNDDVVVLTRDWLDILKKPFEDSRVGITGPLKFYWDCGGAKRNAIAFWCCMISRTLIKDIGILDEAFNPGMGEDGDYCIKAELAGYRLVQVPVDGEHEFGSGDFKSSFPIFHKGNGTFGEIDAKDSIVIKNTKVLEKRYSRKNPVYSIIVPSCSFRDDVLAKCIERILIYTDLSDKEIIVAANGCDDGTIEYLSSIKDKVNVLVWPYTNGYVFPVNSAVKVSRGEFIVLLDDDCLLLPQEKDGWIQKLSSPFAFPHVGMTGLSMCAYPYLGDAVHSFCVMIRRDVWDAVGGLCEDFGFGYLVDTDLCLNMRARGFDIVDVGKNRDFPLYHPDSPVTSDKKKKNVDLMRKNRAFLYERHYKKPMYSIVIPTYNHLDDLLKPCLEGLVRSTNLEDVEVIVVANGCKDGTAEYVDSLGFPFKLVWFDEGLGYTKAANEGIKVARGDYVILLNNDVVFLENLAPKNTWIEMLVKPFLEDSKVGISGPLELFDRYANRSALIFFCVCIKREMFDIVGMLDELYSPGGGEDISFCALLQDAGYKQVIVPDSNVIYTNTNVGGFPMYHKGEGTFTDAEFPEYGKRIIKENGYKNLLKFNKNIRLNLGSGGIEIPGYLSVDKNDHRAALVMDVFDLNLPENSVEEIIALHIFEHLSPYRSMEILAKWRKMLKPGGKLIMEMPDILGLCKAFIASNRGERYGILNAIYGAVNTSDSGNSDEVTSFHQWGWYDEHLWDHLVNSGYVNIQFMPEQHPHPAVNFRVECYKPC